MKSFYIETDRLISINRLFRFYYFEDENGKITFDKIIDPKTKETVSITELVGNTDPDLILNIQTAYMANYKRVYF